MTNEITLSDSDVKTLEQVLGLAEDATTYQQAFYLDEASAERVSELKETIEEQTADAPEVTA